MRVHDDWATPAFELDPTSPNTGPFVRREMLRVWTEVRGDPAAVRLVENGSGLLAFYATDATLQFIGEKDLIDYRSPLGSEIPALVASYLEQLPPGTTIRFDSLPSDAAAAIGSGLALIGLEAEPVQHEIAAILELPSDEAEWLAGLERKQRHEVRRKARRFEAAAGTISLRREHGKEATAAFIAMHRLAHGAKGAFMNPGMGEFFTALEARAEAVIDFLDGAEGPVAAAFGFEDQNAYYFYNSAYDPDAAELSPGIILVQALVRQAIRSGKRIFDFLKGDEMYKFKLGASPRPLYAIETSLERGR